MTTDNYNHPDDEDRYDYDDEIGGGEPDYWECNVCHYTCVREPGFGHCPKCTALMEPQYY